MAFLDELKKEAEAQKLQEQTQTQSKLEAVSQNFVLVQTKYKEMHQYLRELVNQLNVLKLETRRSYLIEGFGMVNDCVPRDFALNVDTIRIGQKDYINTLILRFRCVSDQTISIERDVPSQIDNMKDYLWQSNLKYQCTEFRNDRGVVARAVFNVTNEIPVSLRFSADFENAKIALQIKNLNGLRVSEYQYEADEVTHAYLDELAKYLLDKPNGFRDIGRHQQSIRDLTRQARQHREMETTYIMEQSEVEAGLKKIESGRSGLFDKLKSILS